MRLTVKELEDLARKYGASPKAIERILGSTLIKFGEQRFSIGLMLDRSSLELLEDRDTVLNGILETLRNFKKLCPKVLQWIQRGDFDPTKVPSSIKRAELLHANRTGARLRAELIRSRENKTVLYTRV